MPRIGVLFLQSQAFFGADSAIHAALMKYLDRSAVHVHVACTIEEPDNPAVSSIRRLRSIPDLHIRPTRFGPSIHGISQRDRLRSMAGAVTVAGSLAALGVYIRRHHIQIIHGTEKPRDAF